MADERMPWTAENIQANAPAFLQALIDAGIDPSLTPDEVMTPGLREQVLMAEGRERARPRYQQALDRAQRYGYQQLADRIENLVEAEAQRHARRGLRRSGGIGSNADDAARPWRSIAASVRRCSGAAVAGRWVFQPDASGPPGSEQAPATALAIGGPAAAA